MSQEAPKAIRQSKKQRLSLVLPAPLYEAAQEARKHTGDTTLTSLMQNAIRLYISALEAEKRGEQLVIKDKNGTNQRVADVKVGIY